MIKYGDVAEREIPPDKVRFLFDLMSEIVQNALKYDGKDITRIRVREFQRDGSWGLTFSSVACFAETWTRTVEGHPYISLSDSLFREGNSGLDKIAAIAATIAGGQIGMVVHRRGQSFHLEVPFGRRDEFTASHPDS